MKPENWNRLTEEDRMKVAERLLFSKRGEYIISQALYIAIEEMKKVGDWHREESNIEDMEIFLETLFPLYAVVKMAERERNYEKVTQ